MPVIPCPFCRGRGRIALEVACGRCGTMGFLFYAHPGRLSPRELLLVDAWRYGIGEDAIAGGRRWIERHTLSDRVAPGMILPVG